ncbi:hydroxyethylthiazole kinase [Ferrimonas aestuarii]|uniref:Hydroxyethylthiazole kinase n=1 Tax=Ferrimonas aestuarii TaxID=2569539 RepID=A0A4U1BPG6_9GAMM|nr:hydroxyethylthiazole kinase [Ferrimonas aestuarii]TKB56004.1 hydroxyethylthiazole kinase [Ferrimonas aestuarii]
MDHNECIQKIGEALTQLRTAKPLVVNLTNYVVMNNSANALLAIGASPIMAHSRQEMAEMMSFAGSLVINIGTLDSHWISRMRFAIEQANEFGKPVVLDPVGCGASRLRTDTARDFAELANKLTIRGNASEIMAMAGAQAQSKGVDALDSSQSAVMAAKALVTSYGANVVISGATDFVVTATEVVKLENGNSLMPFVTGMGCSHTAITGAFAAIGETTGLAATAVMGVAGQEASSHAAGPGSLQVNLLDELYQLTPEQLELRLKLSVVN